MVQVAEESMRQDDALKEVTFGKRELDHERFGDMNVLFQQMKQFLVHVVCMLAHATQSCKFLKQGWKIRHSRSSHVSNCMGCNGLQCLR